MASASSVGHGCRTKQRRRVMTPEFGAASQLEKIEMLDHADVVAINKFDRKGGEDALRDVRKQLQRNRKAFAAPPESLPVYGTIASRFNDDGVTALYHGLLAGLSERGFAQPKSHLPTPAGKASSAGAAIVPPARSRYLAEIAETVRGYHATATEQARLAREARQLDAAGRLLSERGGDGSAAAKLAAERQGALDHRARQLLETWPSTKAKYERDKLISTVRGRETRSALTTTTLSGTRIRKVVPPEFSDHGDLLRWLLRENLPGRFPYTAGVCDWRAATDDDEHYVYAIAL